MAPSTVVQVAPFGTVSSGLSHVNRYLPTSSPPPKIRPDPTRIHTTPQTVLKHRSRARAATIHLSTLPQTQNRPRSHRAHTISNSTSPASSIKRMRDSLMKTYSPNDGGYELLQDRRLGSGRWSNVFLARPSTVPSPSPLSYSSTIMTPPPSPRISMQSHPRQDNPFPEYYAIKVAANRSSIGVLQHEAKILTHLTSILSHRDHIVPFHGYDMGKNAIVFTAMPTNLESLINHDLTKLKETERHDVLLNNFTHIAKSLVSSLAWLHAAGIIHADIKSANILLRPDSTIGPGQQILDCPFTPILADFTSSIRKDNLLQCDCASHAMGGGSYDFLAPELLARDPSTPSESSDIYALALTLLQLITGVLPLASAAGNKHRLIAMAAAGTPFQFAMQDARSLARFENLKSALKKKSGFDLTLVLQSGMKKKSAERMSAKEWSHMFLSA